MANKRFRARINPDDPNDTTNKVHMIREELRDGKTITIDAWLPVGLGWNQSNPGAVDWINNGCGWRSYDEYMATQHSAEVASKREKK